MPPLLSGFQAPGPQTAGPAEAKGEPGGGGGGGVCGGEAPQLVMAA